ncbi:MAG: hypothetical protein KY468_01560 [Armatimonadetes bacterium]|nr:hypothetical protein [Armatimonadota bacterium]
MFPRIALAFLLGTMATLNAHAAWQPTIEVVRTPGAAVLKINNRPALRFDNAALLNAVPDRPETVANRLQYLVNNRFNPAWISVKDTPQGAIIIAGGGALLTVTDAEAKTKKMSRQTLANTWAKTLKELLSQPPVSASPSQAALPLGETRPVQIGGALAGPINVRLQPEGVVRATVDPSGRKVLLQGVSVGSGVMAVEVDGETVTVPFVVKKAAGRVESATLAVTGSGPERLTLRGIVKEMALRNIKPEPGAVVKWDGDFQLPKSIPPGGAVVSLPVRIEGENYFPVRGHSQVRLVKEAVGRTEPNLLFYSNDPEMLRKYYGVLYTGQIRANQAVRFLYHHQSAMDSPIRFSLQLKNGDAPARLQIIDGAANPQVDTYQIGHRAAAKFFPTWLNDSGYIRNMEPGETLTLLNQTLAKDVTSSGIYHFVLLSGSNVTLQLRADPPDTPLGIRQANLNPEFYPTTRKKIQETYSVGGRWSFISFGREPVKTPTSTHPLLGNYGVVYDVSLKLENPTGQKNTADVIFDPSAGIARGVFLVNGQMIETSHLRPPQEFTLGSYPLEPGEQKEIRIITMPLAGSNYPARITVRPRQAVVRQPTDSAVATTKTPVEGEK